MITPTSRSFSLLALLALGCVVAPSSAWAVTPISRTPEPDDDLPLAIDLHEDAAHALWRDDPGPHAPLWVSVGGLLHVPDEGAREVGLLVIVALPLDRLARRAARPADLAPHDHARRLADTRAFGEEAPGALKPGRRSRAAPEPPREVPAPRPAPLAPLAEATVDPPPTIPIAIGSEVARSAVRAALRRARLAAPDAALDALGARARASALLPELRMRVLRRADDGQALAPTEYDPTRTTASTGQSLWLEARATWRLDRLVFADDEVAIERLRDQRAEAQAKLVGHVLDLLFAWQRASTAAADPKRTPEERLEATLRRIEAEAALDVTTDGWFSRWLSSRP